MALKFRRGTTAQQSGSLAFGEPYVNTTLGTLLVGGPDGDIVLSTTGTGSTGTFGAISGSGLDITGNANIAGNLTLGGQLTIGDNTSDTVNVVASLSSSLIPSENSVFDLGSPTKIWKDLYISTGSIRMMDGAGNEVAILSADADGMAFDSDITANGVTLGKGGGSLLGNTALGLTALTSNTTGNNNTVVGSTAGAFNTTGADNTLVGRAAGYINQTGTHNTAVGAETLFNNSGSANTVVGYGGLKRTKTGQFNIALGYLAGQYAASGSSNNILIGYSAGPESDEVINNELYIGVNGENSLIRGNFTGAQLRINGKLDVRDNLTISGSIVSAQITALEASASAAKSTNDAQDVSVSNINSFTSSINTTIKSKLDADGVLSGSLQSQLPSGVVSGSSQIVLNDANKTGFDTTDVSEGTNLYYTDARVKTKLDAEGVVSGSAQINLASVTGNSTSNVTEGSNLYYTDARVKTKLDAEGVISGSSQVTISSTTGYSAFSSSLDSRISTEKGRVDAILASADANYDTFAEIVGLINSVDTSNDNAFAAFYTASNGRLSNLESKSASVDISVSNLNSFTSSINTTIKSKLDVEGVVSGSSQVIGILSSLNTYTGSNDTTNTTQNTRLTALEASASTALSTNNTQATSITNLNSTTASLNVSISNINSYTSSNDSTNSTQNTRLTALEASASTALSTNNTQATSITNLNSTTASLNTSVSNLNSFSSSALTRLSNLEGTDISITLTGDVTGTGTITNLGNVSFATTVAANSVALGTDTTGDYVASLVAGTGVSLSNNSGEGATPTIAIGQAVATSSSPTFAGLTINGAITATGDITAYYSSDKRFKSNIQLIPNALEKVSKLNGVTWTWNEDVNEVTKSTPNTGLIAQEVQEVLPEVVMEREDGHLGLDYSKMVGLLVEAIKEQQTQIHNLTLEVEKLKSEKGL